MIILVRIADPTMHVISKYVSMHGCEPELDLGIQSVVNMQTSPGQRGKIPTSMINKYAVICRLTMMKPKAYFSAIFIMPHAQTITKSILITRPIHGRTRKDHRRAALSMQFSAMVPRVVTLSRNRGKIINRVTNSEQRGRSDSAIDLFDNKFAGPSGSRLDDSAIF